MTDKFIEEVALVVGDEANRQNEEEITDLFAMARAIILAYYETLLRHGPRQEMVSVLARRMCWTSNNSRYHAGCTCDGPENCKHSGSWVYPAVETLQAVFAAARQQLEAEGERDI